MQIQSMEYVLYRGVYYELTLGHTNLIFCFMSRKVSRRESVGRLVFVNHVNVRHCEVVNLIIKPQTLSKDG